MGVLKLTGAVVAAICAAFLLATGAAALGDRMAVASVLLVAMGVVLVALAWWLYRTSEIEIPKSWERGAMFFGFRRPATVHRVAVYDVHPAQADQDQFDPYFIALCECGWVADARTSSGQAFDDAYGHDPNNVDKEVKRPVS
jgi:hypothetical protein